MARIPIPTADTGSGLLVPTYAELAPQASAPAAPATGKTRVYLDSNGLLQLLPSGAAPVRRVVTHWGSGTAFPTGPATGDTFLRTDVGTGGTLYQYAGAGQGSAGWITEAAVVCTSTTHPTAGLYAGLQLLESDTKLSWQYDGAAWRQVTNNAGTSGVLAGSAPPAGVPLLIKTFTGNELTNGTGDITLTFPGGAFPNGLVAIHANTIGNGNAPATGASAYYWQPWAPALSSCNFRLFSSATATPVGPGGAMTLIATAIGW